MRTLLPTALLALALTACSGGDAGGGPEEPVTVTQTVEVPTPTADPTEAQEPEVDGPVPPNVGDDALTVGEARKGADVTTVLLEVRDPYAPAEYREPEPGNRFVGLRLSQCLSDDFDTTEGELYATYNGEWVAVTSDGDEYPGSGSSYTDWPRPKFPENATVPPGSCVKGWMTVELPERLRWQRFVWRPGGETTAEWLRN